MRLVCRFAVAAVIAGICHSLLYGGLVVMAASPVTVPTPPTLPASPIIITAYQVNGNSLEFVQIYNNSNELVSLEGAELLYSHSGDNGVYRAAGLEGLMLPRTHGVVAAEGLFSDIAIKHYVSIAHSGPVLLNSLYLVLPGMAPATVPSALKTNGSIQQRGKTSTGYSSVTFGNFDGTLYADSLYTIPTAPPLRVVEILSRAKSCQPFDPDPLCGDYVKFAILPGFTDERLLDYRLRSDTGSESVTNTFSLSYASRHGDYLLLRLRDDGEQLSLSNSGGYVWLEDRYGIQRYNETLTSYADSGSADYIGVSWAHDDSAGTWKRGVPNPTGQNTFPQVLAAEDETIVTPTCASGKYLNPETNRCRSIEEAVSALATCEEGKERNPLTNRCRSIQTVTSTSLTPCDTGEERNPTTNRCRKVSAATVGLVPCQPGYERSIETNRCRKSVLAATSLAAPAAVNVVSDQNSSLKNALIITAGLGAVSYGLYEWRSEMVRLVRRLVGIGASK